MYTTILARLSHDTKVFEHWYRAATIILFLLRLIVVMFNNCPIDDYNNWWAQLYIQCKILSSLHEDILTKGL